MSLDDNLPLNVRALTKLEAIILSARHPHGFIALAELAAGLETRDLSSQVAALTAFAYGNVDLLNDTVAFGSDQHAQRSAVEALSIDLKLLALGQIMTLTGIQMRAEDAQFADIPAPSAAVH